jgi:hypothetical protein
VDDFRVRDSGGGRMVCCQIRPASRVVLKRRGTGHAAQ